jgi:hypothetical protein
MTRTLLAILIGVHLCSRAFASNEAHLKQCQAKLKKAQQLGMLLDIRVNNEHFDVVVGPTFYNVPFHSKERFAETLNCLLNAGETGPKRLCNEIDFLNWQTGKLDGKYSSCQLTLY